MEFSQKKKIYIYIERERELPYDLTILLLGIYLKKGGKKHQLDKICAPQCSYYL